MRPDEASVKDLAFADGDLGRNMTFFFHHMEEAKKIVGVDQLDHVSLQGATIKVEQIYYYYSDEHSFIHLSIANK